MPNSCQRCLVSGKVQGVFYRASAARKAAELGVTGYARNLSDGRVEVLACGEPAAVKALCEWLWEGPAYAQISDVQCEAVECDVPERFVTR